MTKNVVTALDSF